MDPNKVRCAVVAFFGILMSLLFCAYSTQTSYCPPVEECKCETVNSSFIKLGCHHLSKRKIPNFPSNVVYIDLSFNLITEVNKEVIIPPKIEYLDLSKNVIVFIDRGVMSHLSALRYLDLSHNLELTFAVLPNISYNIQLTSLRVFKLNGIHCENGKGTILRYYDFKFLSNTSLAELEIASNRIEDVESHIIQNLPKTLTKIDISNNRFITGYYMLEIQFLKHVKLVNLSYTSSVYGPNTALKTICDDKKRRQYLTSNFARDNKRKRLSHIRYKPRNVHLTVYFPSSLEIVDVRNSFIHYDATGSKVISYDIPNLKKFYAQGNFLSKMYGRSVSGNKTEYLDLSNNYCSYISSVYFEGAIRLKSLNLSNNYLGLFFRNESSSTTFRKLRHLENLDLSSNGINQIPFGLLSPLIELRHLNLASNSIKMINLPLDRLKKLKSLDLSSNQIQFLYSNKMKYLDFLCKRHHLFINLGKNTLRCSCETFDFLKWMQKHKSKKCITFIDLQTYRCTYKNLTELSLDDIDRIVEDLSLHCSSNIGLIASSIFVVLLFLVILVSAILYRYRWKIRYLYYTTKRVFVVAKAGNIRIFKYDVFLSYADEDKDFVHNEILKNLEGNGWGIKVCCHARDFTPGRPIADNIAAAIHDSRYTMCVISRKYIDSYWCMYEFNLAKMETEYARGGENAIMLVLLNDIPSANLPLPLINHIETQSYLEVPPHFDEESRLQFAERLKVMIS